MSKIVVADTLVKKLKSLSKPKNNIGDYDNLVLAYNVAVQDSIRCIESTRGVMDDKYVLTSEEAEYVESLLKTRIDSLNNLIVHGDFEENKMLMQERSKCYSALDKLKNTYVKKKRGERKI